MSIKTPASSRKSYKGKESLNHRRLSRSSQYDRNGQVSLNNDQQEGLALPNMAHGNQPNMSLNLNEENEPPRLPTQMNFEACEREKMVYPSRASADKSGFVSNNWDQTSSNKGDLSCATINVNPVAFKPERAETSAEARKNFFIQKQERSPQPDNPFGNNNFSSTFHALGGNNSEKQKKMDQQHMNACDSFTFTKSRLDINPITISGNISQLGQTIPKKPHTEMINHPFWPEPTTSFSGSQPLLQHQQKSKIKRGHSVSHINQLEKLKGNSSNYTMDKTFGEQQHTSTAGLQHNYTDNIYTNVISPQREEMQMGENKIKTPFSLTSDSNSDTDTESPSIPFTYYPGMTGNIANMSEFTNTDMKKSKQAKLFNFLKEGLGKKLSKTLSKVMQKQLSQSFENLQAIISNDGYEYCEADVAYNDFIWYKIFSSIAEKISIENKNLKKKKTKEKVVKYQEKLFESLFENYGEAFKKKEKHEILACTRNDETAVMECLQRWKLHSNGRPNLKVLTDSMELIGFADISETIEKIHEKNSKFSKGKKTADDETLRNISDNVGKEFEKLATYLGYSIAEVENFKMNHSNRVQDAVFAMLVDWRDTKCKGNNQIKAGRLCTILLTAGYPHLAKMLQ